MQVNTVYRFERVSVKRKKKWTDIDGFKRQKTKTFEQTLNPFNKNADGTVKTRAQILIEINKEADAWVASDATD